MIEETSRDPWELESAFVLIAVRNISSQVPMDQWPKIVWQEIGERFETCETIGDVYLKLRQWNHFNDPELPDDTITQMIGWAFDNWPNKFRQFRKDQ